MIATGRQLSNDTVVILNLVWLMAILALAGLGAYVILRFHRK